MEGQRKNQRAQLPVSSVKTPKPEAKFASLPTSYAPRRVGVAPISNGSTFA